MRTRHRVALLVGVFGLIAVSGCGAPCQNLISAQRQIHDSKVGAPDGRPHAQLRLPHNRLNVLLEAALAADPIRTELTLPGGLPLPAAAATARRVEIRPADGDKLGFYVEVELTIGEYKLLDLSATIEARTETTFRGERAALEVSFDADSLRTVTPVYPVGAVDAVAAALGPAIRAVSGQEVPGPMLRPIARRLMNYVSEEAFGLIRDHVLARVGEVASLRVDMGKTPIARIATHTDRGPQPALVIDIFTKLPILVGLSDRPVTAEPISGTGRLRITGEAIAELGNWAIAEGLAPQTYDSQLRPDPSGAYVPVYAWREGSLPLVVHAFRIEPPCSTIVIGARPEVKVEDGTITVGIVDGNVESVQGSSLMKIGVGLKDLFSDDIEKSSTGAANAAFEIGGRPVDARLIDAKLEAGELDLTVLLVPSGGEEGS